MLSEEPHLIGFWRGHPVQNLRFGQAPIVTPARRAPGTRSAPCLSRAWPPLSPGKIFSEKAAPNGAGSAPAGGSRDRGRRP
jgi:hypothetical protein